MKVEAMRNKRLHAKTQKKLLRTQIIIDLNKKSQAMINVFFAMHCNNAVVSGNNKFIR